MLGSADDVPTLRGSLDHEEVEDDVEPFSRLRRGRERIEEMAARMALIQRSR